MRIRGISYPSTLRPRRGHCFRKLHSLDRTMKICSRADVACELCAQRFVMRAFRNVASCSHCAPSLEFKERLNHHPSLDDTSRYIRNTFLRKLQRKPFRLLRLRRFHEDRRVNNVNENKQKQKNRERINILSNTRVCVCVYTCPLNVFMQIDERPQNIFRNVPLPCIISRKCTSGGKQVRETTRVIFVYGTQVCRERER